MKRVSVNNSVIEFYDSAEKMTMKRYQRFNKFLMIDNEVGSDFDAFNVRLGAVVKYLKNGMQTEAVSEMENWRQSVYNAYTEYMPKSYAFALLVYKIDDEVFTDISSGGLDRVLDKLEELGVSYETANATVSEVKKK